MIQSLTAHQESQLAVCRDRWLKIGLSTAPCDLEEAKKYAVLAYQAGKLSPPKYFFVGDSPPHAARMAILLKGTDQNLSDVDPEGLRDMARRDLPEVFTHGALSQAHAEFAFGAHDAAWLGFYDFFSSECGVKGLEVLNGLRGLAQVCGWWAPYTDVCIFQHRPAEIHFDDGARLHHDRRAAIVYPDGYSVYALHGIRVQAWIVTTPAEQLTAHDFTRIKNQEEARAFLQKFGAERLLTPKNSTVIDSQGQYSLLSVKLGTGSGARVYLKMMNPSEGCWHVEPVAPTCKTVQDALNYRRYGTLDVVGDWLPSIVT